MNSPGETNDAITQPESGTSFSQEYRDGWAAGEKFVLDNWDEYAAGRSGGETQHGGEQA